MDRPSYAEALRKGFGEDRTSSTRHARVEVFSARLLSMEPRFYQNVFGVIILGSGDYNCVIFESSLLEPPLINAKGHITLTGPECSTSMPVKDKIVLGPWLIEVGWSDMNKEEKILWRSSDEINAYICKTKKILCNTDLEMHFAVYNDAVEANLDVFLVDMESGAADGHILVHGTVTAYNSVVSHDEAKSYLFHKESGQYVCLKPDKFMALPLSRRMVVAPRYSTLYVDVSIAIGSKPEDASIAENTIKFTAVSNFPECDSLISDCGKVCVKVTWKECKDHV